MRRVTAVGCLAVLAVGLAACGSDTRDGTLAQPAPPAASTDPLVPPAVSASPRPPTTVTATVPATAALTAARVVDAIEAAGLPATGRADRTRTAGCADLNCSQMIAVDPVSVYQFIDEAAAEKYATALSASSLIYRNGSIVLRFKRDGPNPIDRDLIPRYQAVLDGLMP